MDWSIQEVARLTGTTSRALRHYDDIGLLTPTRTATNGYRRYDDAALVRLQRILLLRDLGLPLPEIARVLDREADPVIALARHRALLENERELLDRRIASVSHTIETLEGGGQLMAHDMFDGFDHTEYREEVTERWGADAYAASDAWWRGMSTAERDAWKRDTARLGADWQDAAARGIATDSAEAQALAERHVAWLTAVPGTPAASGSDVKAYVTGLAEMYVADPRFAANYGGEDGARFVRDALFAYADREL